MEDQHQLYERARKRVAQKKRLYYHFIVFILGLIFTIVLNQVFELETKIFVSWHIVFIILWSFLFCLHLIKVFVTNRFFGKEWERIQTDKLIAKHHKKAAAFEKKFLKEEDIKLEAQQNTEQVITIIAAAAQNNELGKDNKLIWHLSDDLKRFKRLTSGHHIIMGRKTFESFPNALPNRTNVVITRDKNYTAENAVVVHSLEAALALAKNDEQPFIIGGGEIYRQSLAIANKIELTRVHESFEADTFFPEIDLSIWKETFSEVHAKDEKHPHDYTFITYERK